MNCAQWDRVSAEATTRSQIHWFDDGNIILEAGGKLFKVHRGVLSKNSGIFKDMFGLPQPPEQFTIEDCPIVNLSDSEEDVHHFLNVIYIPLYYGLHQRQPFSLLAAMVRLGHKYEALHIRDAAVASLQAEYPQNLTDWEAGNGYCRIADPFPGLEFDVLNLAQEHRLLTVLPSVYLGIIFSYTLADVFRGEQRLDGSMAEISVKHKLICASAAELIEKAAKDMTFAWIGQLPSSSCKQKKSCHSAGRKVFYDIFHKPFGALQGLTTWKSDWGDLLCESCVLMAKNVHEKGRLEMWNFVPIACELGDWESLTNF